MTRNTSSTAAVAEPEAVRAPLNQLALAEQDILPILSGTASDFFSTTAFGEHDGNHASALLSR